MKKILSIMLTLVLIFSLAACGGSDQSGGDTTAENAEKSEESGDSSSEDGTVEITYATWGMETEMQEMVDLYNASQNQVHVTLQVTPLSEYGTLMNEVLGTEEGPDVLWAGLQTRLWGNAGMLAELQDKVYRGSDGFERIYGVSVETKLCGGYTLRNSMLYGFLCDLLQ